MAYRSWSNRLDILFEKKKNDRMINGNKISKNIFNYIYEIKITFIVE